MQPRRPSLTARSAAAMRAVHQVLEGGRVFAFGTPADLPSRPGGRIVRAGR